MQMTGMCIRQLVFRRKDDEACRPTGQSELVPISEGAEQWDSATAIPHTGTSIVLLYGSY
jgi:hypothetical protein